MDLETKSEWQMKRGGGRAYRSRLELFADFIREQRQQRRTWQEIAARLRTEQGCDITFQGLHQFYRRHLKRLAQSHWENEVPAARPSMPAVLKPPTPARKPVLAVTPPSRSFRQPNPENLNLNDPTKL
jgi:hypothetical protein